MMRVAIRPMISMILGAVLSGTGLASAEQFPSQPIKLIVPFGAGGVTDIVARPLAQQLSIIVGQPVIVDNRPGASGTLGTNMAAKAKPDGYTMLITTRSFAMNAYLFSRLPFDPVKDFTPLTMALNGPGYLLVTRADSPYHNLQELVAAAKKQPGKLSYGSPGQGVLGAMELFKKEAGVDIVHVPYKSSAEVSTAMMGGQVELTAMLISEAQPFLEQKKIRALAIASMKRAKGFETIPTLAEAGYPRIESDGYYALWLPAGTPKDRVEFLYRSVKQALETADFRQTLARMGYDVVASTPEEFSAFIVKDIALQKTNLERVGLRPQ
jgi:tripartite-type tricarboxylate transporter receptor subunit TctC